MVTFAPYRLYGQFRCVIEYNLQIFSFLCDVAHYNKSRSALVNKVPFRLLNRNLEATKNNLSCLQVLECGSKIITTPDGLYVLKGDLPEGRNYVAHVINGDYNANSAKIEKVIIQDNNVVVQFVGAVNNPFLLNNVIFSVT